MGEREALVERDLELAHIDDLLERASGGAGGAVVVEGPAGIGKTSLLTAAGESARRIGYAVAHARGGELERDLPFVVVRDLFRQAIEQSGAEDRDDVFVGTARFATTVTAPEPGSGAPEPAIVFEGLVQLAENIAAGAPLLLAIDDLHWADPSSAHFVGYLASRLDGQRVALLLATRPAYEHADVRLLDTLRRAAGARILQPSPLSLNAATELVRRRFESPAPEFAAACHKASAGNPLYLGALLDAAAGLGLTGAAQDAATLSELGPEAVAVSVRGRFAALPSDARELASAIAVMGSDAELRHVAQLADLDDARSAAAAATLQRAELIVAEEPLAFVHPVVRAIVYELRTPIERAADHARAARLLHAASAPAYRIGPHLLAATRSAETWVVDDLREAARDALKRAAPDQAVAFLERAVEVAADRETRPALLRELATAEWRAGHDDALAHLRLAISEAPQPGDEYRLVGWLLATHRLDEALRILDDLIAAAASEREQMYPLAQYVAIGQMAGIPDLADRARRLRVLVDALGDDEGVATTVVGWLDVLAGDVTGAQRLERVITRALDSGARVQQVELWIYTAWGLLAAERFDSVARIVDRAVAEARTRGSSAMTAMAFNCRAQLAYRTGRLDEAEPAAQTALEAIGRGGLGAFGAGARMAYLECLTERGEEAGPAATDDHVRDVEAESVDERGFAAALDRYGLGRLRVATGDVDGGVAMLVDSGRRLTSALATNPGYVPWRGELALALARGGDRAQAATLAAEELRLARTAGTPRAYGMALRAVASVAGGDEAIEILHEATGVLANASAPLEHARALTDLGAAMRRRRMQLESRDVLRDALDIAHRCGSQALGARATAELHASGARPRTPALAGVEALTPSERRVARLATSGRTNREIAEELFVTIKTVEKHLAGCYRKLNISSRDELPPA